MPDSVTLTVYGGAPGEIGGNRIVLEWTDRRWLLDFGMRFGAVGRFFEEFVQPRGATLGLRDYLRMGLIPPLEGLYRDDLSAHDPDLWARYRDHPQYRKIDRVDGVLLSHGHVDHVGSLGFLRDDIPVYTGLTTAIIGKCLQDPKPTGVDGEFNYLVPRSTKGGGVLEAACGAPRIQRKHYIATDGTDVVDPKEAMPRLDAFWGSVPGERTSIQPAPLELRDQSQLSRLGLRFWRVDHSIPGSAAFGIDTPMGWVIYSGDLRMHGHSRKRTEKFVREARALKPAVLIIEGTRVGAGRAGSRERDLTSEPQVHDAADKVVQGESGLVIADFTARNIERLRTFRDIAQARGRGGGRRLVVTTKDAYMLEQLNVIDPNIPHPGDAGLAILDEPVGTVQSWEKEVRQRFAANMVGAAAIRREPGGYILCLSYWDITNLIDLEPASGTYIYSSSEAHSEEQEIDVKRLVNWLDHFQMKKVGGLPGAEQGPYHASGHIDGPALEGLIEEIGAERIVPVHTEHPEWFEERWGKRVVVVREGVRFGLG
ncbi:MAG TPA: MBL fold metallo-hydrolase [Gemmatimonadales bacterium]|nr:MBL fold metallo-hydrolase [Gemmatimonadales bacterium]